jgi:hypothetical protein
MEEGNVPLVLLSHHTVALPARSIVDLERSHIGLEVVLSFEGGDRSRPVVLGVIREVPNPTSLASASQVEVDSDGHRVIVSARRELVLRCGEASITLDYEGRITLRGAHITSHSKGVNRIRGGSVQLN